MVRNIKHDNARRPNAFSVTAQFSVCLVIFSCGAFSQATEWVIAPSIYVGVDHTDNVGLTPKGTGENEIITELSPSVLLTRDGQQVDISIDYRFQALLYANNDKRNEGYNYLGASMTADVVPGLFFIEAESSISQSVIDSRLGTPYSAISVSGYTTEVSRISVSPTLQRKLAPHTTARANVRYGLVEYAVPDINDSKNTEFEAALINEGGAGPIDWNLSFTSNTIEYDIGREVQLKRISAEMGYRIGPRTEVVLSGGEDINDFPTQPGAPKTDGSFWNAGLRGEIGAQIQYDVRVGEQFFGDSYSLLFTRTSRRLITKLDYVETITTQGAEQFDYINAFPFIPDVQGFDLPTATPDLYIRKRGNVGQTVTLGKTTFTVGAFYEDRTFITAVDMESGDKEINLGATFDWTWSYDDVTNVSANANYRKLNARGSVEQPEDFQMAINVRRTLLEDSFILLRYWRNTRSATLADREYIENTFTVGYGRNF